MILDSMLSNSPVFLFLMSGFLLTMYAVARLIKACAGAVRRWWVHAESRPVVR